MPRTRYAQVGLGVRSWIYSLAVANRYADRCELVGLCDANAGRLQQRVKWGRANQLELPAFGAADFDAMLATTRPDCVIVTCPDADHDGYICRAMELGCDVITEKPLTIDAEKLQRILDTQKRSGRHCAVTFNYRYSPPREQVKELLQSGIVGEVLSVDFHWLLDTRHGADYFRRWHRRKENSGGLLVHKATHHFDLVNWWLDSTPVRVFASGQRRYYTPAQARRLGLEQPGERCLDCAESERCPFHLDLRKEKWLGALYLAHEQHDGYFRDRCVFSDEIDIEDTANVLVDYGSGARMAYSLNAFMPREGYSVSFNGTKGRLDHSCEESSYVSGGDEAVPGALEHEKSSIRFAPHFAEPIDIPVRSAEGSHAGGDERLIEGLFGDPAEDDLGRAATHVAGAWSVLTGIAANRSIETGEAIRVEDLVKGLDSFRPTGTR